MQSVGGALYQSMTENHNSEGFKPMHKGWRVAGSFLWSKLQIAVIRGVFEAAGI